MDAALWLADMQDQGAIGHVGLTNFDAPHLIQVGDVCVGGGVQQHSLVDFRCLLQAPCNGASLQVSSAALTC